jgi:serine/threonine protein kinase/peptidoglycan hydrolase-like protein with peptidoglycan-binding domain
MSGQLDLRGVLPMGTMLRSYELLSVLGHGGFGVTYLARDTTLDRRVAIKEYLPIALALRENDSTVVPRSTELASEFTWGRERFLDEARTLGKLSAPAIVHVYDFLEANGTAYMVMALAAGETLDNRIARGPLPPPVIDRLLPPLLEGLAHVHEAGFLHRDIKPANILVDGENRPTLIDFGASRAAIAGRTAAMTAIFTPGYAAAEQFSSAKQGPWTDIYGLSATLYHAITGSAPPSAIERILDDEYQPLTRLMPAGFLYTLLAAIDAGMAVRAANRPQSIAEWRATMHEGRPRAEAAATIVMPRAQSRPGPEPEQQPEERAPRRKRSPLRRAIIVGLILLGAGGYFGKGIFQTTDKPRRMTDVAATAPAPAPVQTPPVDDTAARVRQQQAEAEAATARQAEDDAKKKAAAEADAKRQADAAAAKAQAEDDARKKAAAEAEAKRQTDEAAAAKTLADTAAEKKAAETAEAGLRLATPDRQRLQVALTASGFDTRGVDGTFGPRSREMIAAWQKARNQPPTGFFTAAQQQALLKDGAAAIQKHDDEQKKIEDDKKKAEEEAKKKGEEEKAKAAATPSPTPTPAATPAPTPPAVAGKLLEEKQFEVTNTEGTMGCLKTMRMAIRIYADKIEVQSATWHELPLDSGGNFSGEFTTRNGNLSTISGNVKSRTMTTMSVRLGCGFAGKF